MSKSFLAYNTDNNIRLKSSSGGVFYSLAKQIIKNGGVVFGAVWTSDWRVKIVPAENLGEITSMMGSKYVCADMGDSREKCKEFLDAGRVVLFTSTPCQIHSLKRFLGKEYENLYTCEICCHGVMPIKIWRDYLETIENKNNPIVNINMRDKTHGWRDFSFRVDYSNGETFIESFKNNLYMQAFLSDKYLKSCCYNCKYKNDYSVADFCIGDFWGISGQLECEETDKGVSFIEVQTDKAQKMLSVNNDLFIEEIKKEDILKFNGGKHNVICEERREKYSKDIFVKRDKIGIVTLYLNYNIGGILQAYALQQTLYKLGYDNDIITYDKGNFPEIHIDFVNTHLKTKTLDFYQGYKTLREDEYSTYVVGSDQVWRKKYAEEYWKDYFLKFAERWNVKRIAYAASFGIDDINEWQFTETEDEQIKTYLSKFNDISCREISGVKIVENRYKLNSTLVCDPTLLLNVSDYVNIIKDMPARSGDVFIYTLEETLESIVAVRQFIKINRLSAIMCDDRSVQDWLACMYGCKYVVTDSYHGCLFAMMFKKPFICVKNNVRGDARINTLVEKFHLESNVLDNWGQLSFAKFNYEDKSEMINQYKAESLNWLINALQKSNQVVQKNHSKVCLCAIAKMENHYLREWVEHYKELNFDAIYLYDNNDIDGEHFEDVIKDYIDSGFVKVIDVRGKTNQQIEKYNEFYHTIANNYDYVAFFDIDEFLYIDAPTIQEFVDRPKFTNFNSIAINWAVYDDNDLLCVMNNHYECKDRFLRLVIQPCPQSKRIIKTGIEDITINSSHGAIDRINPEEAVYCETLTNPAVNCCNSIGEKISSNTVSFKNWTYEGAYIRHYQYKTIEEFIKGKMQRGYPTKYKNYGKDISLDDFFTINKKTPEKLNIANKLLDN